jgi:hypothetical protein
MFARVDTGDVSGFLKETRPATPTTRLLNAA